MSNTIIGKHVMLEPTSSNPYAKFATRRVKAIKEDGNLVLTGGITSVGNGIYKDKQSESNGGFGINDYKVMLDPAGNIILIDNGSAAKCAVKHINESRSIMFNRKLDPVKY